MGNGGTAMVLLKQIFWAAFSAPNSGADERGTTMVEYALMASLIAVVCVTSVTFAGRASRDTFKATKDAIAQAAGGVLPGAISGGGSGSGSPPGGMPGSPPGVPGGPPGIPLN